MQGMQRRSFLESLLSLAARGLAFVVGGTALSACPQPVKYGGPPVEPQPTKYGGAVPPGVYPKYGTPSSQPSASQPSRPPPGFGPEYGVKVQPRYAPEYGVREQPRRPPPNIAPDYGIRRQPATQPAPKVKAATKYGGRPTKTEP